MGDNSQNNTPATDSSWPKSFELEIFNMTIDDATGKTIPHRVSYSQPVIIEATSNADLAEKLMLYKQCDQYARVIREIPTAKNPNPSPNPAAPQPQGKPQTIMASRSQPIQQDAPKAVSSKPQYFKFPGGIELKIENGQSYQKQFVRLTQAEASNIRIVDDKTNRVVNLNGKHIEMKKWIVVQETSDDELDSLENSISDSN